MKKIIIALLLLIILSGCHANVNINIDKSLKVTENIEVKESRNALDTNLSDEDYINQIISFEFKDNEIGGYSKNNISDFNYLGLSLNKEYNFDVCRSLKFSALKYAIYDLKCENENGTYTLSGTPSYFRCGDDCFMKPDISSATLNINLPNKAIFSNADNVEDNTYTWNFEGNENEKISLKFKIEEDKDNKTFVNKVTNPKSNYKFVILGLIAFVVLLIILVSNLYTKYKNNKIDY